MCLCLLALPRGSSAAPAMKLFVFLSSLVVPATAGTTRDMLDQMAQKLFSTKSQQLCPFCKAVCVVPWVMSPCDGDISKTLMTQ
jgi:hypothetical protein